jgi:hypothetical protein
METTMSKTNGELRDELRDDELDAVSGGFFADYVKQLMNKGSGSSWLEAIAKAMGEAANARL